MSTVFTSFPLHCPSSSSSFILGIPSQVYDLSFIIIATPPHTHLQPHPHKYMFKYNLLSPLRVAHSHMCLRTTA